MVERYKEVLDKAKVTKLEVLTTWFHFQMKKDPFLTPIETVDISYFIDREKIVKNKIYHIFKIPLPLFLAYVKIINFMILLQLSMGLKVISTLGYFY